MIEINAASRLAQDHQLVANIPEAEAVKILKWAMALFGTPFSKEYKGNSLGNMQWHRKDLGSAKLEDIYLLLAKEGVDLRFEIMLPSGGRGIETHFASNLDALKKAISVELRTAANDLLRENEADSKTVASLISKFK